MIKNPSANARNVGSIPGSGRSLEESSATYSSGLAGKSHGQRSLVGYSLWGCKRVRPNLLTKPPPPFMEFSDLCLFFFFFF